MIDISELNESELYSLEDEIRKIKENKSKVYLYIIEEDYFKELCGNLRSPYINARYCFIRVPTGNKELYRLYEVKNEEGIVYNSGKQRSVWFKKPNIEKAKNALLEYELEKLNYWKDQVKKSEKRIQMIKGEAND